MNRAQEIRIKRLNERKAAEEEKRKAELRVEDEAKKLFDWVLDLFENPTKYNSGDEVILHDTYYHKIQIGCSLANDNITERKFESRVMEKLAKMFNEEDGYSGDYSEGCFPDSDSTVTIKIE